MKKLLIVLAAVSVAGCAYQRFQMDDASATIPSFEGTSHFIFWGLGQTKSIDPREVCGARGVNSVQTNESFLNGLFVALTYGIYSPRTHTIYCNPIK